MSGNTDEGCSDSLTTSVDRHRRRTSPTAQSSPPLTKSTSTSHAAGSVADSSTSTGRRKQISHRAERPAPGALNAAGPAPAMARILHSGVGIPTVTPAANVPSRMVPSGTGNSGPSLPSTTVSRGAEPAAGSSSVANVSTRRLAGLGQL